jgi:NAD(P)-dependent dehydrogenase (short-subunit alcohol dehydrogenase family)
VLVTIVAIGLRQNDIGRPVRLTCTGVVRRLPHLGEQKMKVDLSGKTALVTGSTGGIGLGIAVGLAGSGAAVIINGRGQQKVDAAVATVRKAVPKAVVRGVLADVGTAAGCAVLAAAEPIVDVLVNNAAIFRPTDVFETTDEQWEEMLAVNLLSGLRLSRAYLPGMAARGWGRVVFLSSESALNIPVEMIDYGVTKTAVLGLSRGLAKRMAGTNVTVNAVLPGPTLTEGMAEMLKDEQARTGRPMEEAAAGFVRSARPSSIIRRTTTVEEIANLVVYIASPLSSGTTGAALRVDGGIVDTIT